MANGKISINTDYANNVVSYINRSISNLDQNVSSKLSSDFNSLTESGLVSNSLSKVQEQTRKITSLEQSIADAINMHINDVTDEENKLYSDFLSGLGRNNNLSIVEDDTTTPEGSALDTYEIEKGKKINNNNLTEIIELLDDSEIDSLLVLLEMYKDRDISLKELLLNNDASKELYKSLSSILSSNEDMKELALDDPKEVQKVLLDSIINKEASNVELDTDSILTAKEYLSKVSKDNNISGSDLLFNDSYSNLLKESLNNLYTGNVSEDISTDTINNFKKYIDNIALEENKTPEELINNNLELIY